ncbi:sulfite exporter TauE/SafE family protein [Bacillus fonticola]|uniref:sulfite exporter TauE/SafE family protein n=1 Tax=Bacillus fonticola TaxID=2728853 RepID=UPI001475AC35|nr:sulfite exporter TauE/SafE family protein [Bacillus fonticola]
MDTVVVFIIIILFASVLQTSTGFGFSIMATPFLLLLFEPREAVQINLVLSLVISLALISRIRKEIDFGIMKRFIIGSLIGVPVGIFIFLSVDADVLKLGVSVLILFLTVLLILNFRVKQTYFGDRVVGVLSGVLTTSIGMPGPPLLLYFAVTDTKKEVLRATTLAFYLFIYAVSLVTQLVFSGTSGTVWVSSGLALPIVVVGLMLGQNLYKRINQRMFRLFTYVILLFTGVYLLIESVG